MRLALSVATAWAVIAGCASAPVPPPEDGAPRTSRPALPARAQLSDGPLSLDKVIEFALQHVPAIRTARARVEAAQAGIDAAETAYLPRVDLLWQSVRATRNNISGQFFPQAVVPAISGPVSPRSWRSGWGTSAGALASWELFDFGLRGSQVELYRALALQVGVESDLVRLDVALGAADAFLVLVAAEESARAAKSNVDRWDVFAKAVKPLVDQQLRPGIDSSRAEAELALARTQEILAQQAVDVGRATLLEAMGLGEGTVRIDAAPVLTIPVSAEMPAAAFVSHPLLSRQRAVLQTAEARKSVVDSSYAPRVNLQLSFSGRGSGFGAAGEPLDAEDGLWPNRYNWAGGVSFTFPLMDYFGIEARGRQEEALARSERSKIDEIALSLSAQERKVRAYLDAAKKIVQNTPVQLKAAQEAHVRSRSRYDTGLGNITEVADTQRLLAQAEIDDALARLGVWRALAAAARVQGDVRPLLEAFGRAKEGK
jgi:outer membrane protein